MCITPEKIEELLDRKLAERDVRRDAERVKGQAEFWERINQNMTASVEANVRNNSIILGLKHDMAEVKECVQKISTSVENITPLDKDDVKDLKEMIKGYNGVSVLTNATIRIGSFVVAVGAIVMGFIHIVKAVQ